MANQIPRMLMVRAQIYMLTASMEHCSSPKQLSTFTFVMMQKPIACNDTPVVKNHIQTNGGMKPVTLGTNLNSMGAITSLIQVYANPTNKQFAIVEHFAAQKSCILVQGYNFDILMQLYETF